MRSPWPSRSRVGHRIVSPGHSPGWRPRLRSQRSFRSIKNLKLRFSSSRVRIAHDRVLAFHDCLASDHSYPSVRPKCFNFGPIRNTSGSAREHRRDPTPPTGHTRSTGRSRRRCRTRAFLVVSSAYPRRIGSTVAVTPESPGCNPIRIHLRESLTRRSLSQAFLSHGFRFRRLAFS